MSFALAYWIRLQAVDLASAGGEKDIWGWKPLLVKNGVTPVVLAMELLSANSAIGRSRTQSSCMYVQYVLR